MKDLGYGAGYKYDHDAEGNVSSQTYLPEELAGRAHAGLDVDDDDTSGTSERESDEETQTEEGA